MGLHPRTKNAKTQHGVSLIELMVGMAVGLLATLIIGQVASVYESRKRSTSSGSDAQVNGALALSLLQRQIMSAGFGMVMGDAVGCTIQSKYSGTSQQDRVLAPVIITQGSGDAPDSLRILASSNTQFSVPMRVAMPHRRSDTVFLLDNGINVGNTKGDLMLAVPNAGGNNQVSPNWCSLFNISDPPTANEIRHDTDVAADGKWNQDATSTVFPGTQTTDVSYSPGSFLVNLGQLTDQCYFVANASSTYQPCGLPADSTESSSSYALRTRRFDSTDASTTKEEVYAGVVNLQAVYGLDTDNNRSADTWTTTTPTTTSTWLQLVAVRLVMVVRSSQYEKDNVTTTQPSWLWDGVNSQTLVINTLPDWQHYRYRTFEAVVPVRNMIWRP